MPICELCEKEVERVTRHHLIPQTRHRNRRNKRSFSREEVKERIALLCTNCHRQVHALLTEKELEYDYNTLEKLRTHEEIAKYLDWASRRNLQGKIPVRSRKRR